MDGAPCRSLRAQSCGSPNDRDNIWRSFTPIRRSMDAHRLRPTCSGSLPSQRQPFTRWCSTWSAGDCFAARRDMPAASKYSSLPTISRSCDDRENSIDHNHCAEVLGVFPTLPVSVPSRLPFPFSAPTSGLVASPFAQLPVGFCSVSLFAYLTIPWRLLRACLHLHSHGVLHLASVRRVRLP